MAKDPTPRADALRTQREARYGHLQATITDPPTDQGIGPWVKGFYPGKKVPDPVAAPSKVEEAPAPHLIAYAGQNSSEEKRKRGKQRRKTT